MTGSSQVRFVGSVLLLAIILSACAGSDDARARSDTTTESTSSEAPPDQDVPAHEVRVVELVAIEC